MISQFRSTILTVSIAILATSTATPCAAEKGRVLNDYRFVPSGLTDPFVATSFSNTIGVAIATDVEIPFIVIEDTPPDTLLSVNGSLLFVTATVRYQYAVHDRATIRAGMGGGSRIGTSGSALLAQGITAFTGAVIGTTLELWRTERFLLSGLADIDYSNNLVVDLVQFADDILAGNTQNASILVQDSGATAYGGLASAWALNSWSGLTGIAQAGYTDTELVNSNLVWLLGGSYGLDLGQRGMAPIGFTGTFVANHLKPLANTNGVAYGIDFGIFYTGREDLNVGAELGWFHLPMANRDIVLNPMSFDVVLNYFF